MAGSLPVSGTRAIGATTFARSTVLPRRETPESLRSNASPRYEPVRSLGEGGMGEVVLVHDHDIGRQVAVKRLKADPHDEGAVMRFAEEVRTIGHLEHPGIVPVHDVGVDEQGQHYLVMKYVQGETLEEIIAELKSGDAAYRARFTHGLRVQIFSSMLQALRYAHEKGVIHRDLKPSNIMVGAYGEVMLMDWGIAKKVERGAVDGADHALADTVDPRMGPQRLVQTAVGSLLGTPLYMSPEQSAGKVHELDERSDIYSACLVFLELITLQHPYTDKRTVSELIIAQSTQKVTPIQLREMFSAADAPGELNWFVSRGLEKDRDARYASVAEMERALAAIRDGKIELKCHVTLAKRGAQEFSHWVDRHQHIYTLLFFLTALSLLAGMVFGVISLVRAVF